MKELEPKRSINVGETPDGFPLMQKYPLHILYPQSTYHIQGVRERPHTF